MKPGRIYLDNAATSWPKPPEVYDAVDRYQRDGGAPAGRSAYAEAQSAERIVEGCRNDLARLLGVSNPNRLVFAFNGTDALNLAIRGCLRPGDHVVTTDAEHNSILRPLRFVEETMNVEVTRAPCDANGLVAAEDVVSEIREETRLVVMIHASNVTGAIQPVEEVGRAVRDRKTLLLVDAAQTLGHLPIEIESLGADLVAAPGHKGLLGPLGTGLLYVAPEIESELSPFRCGGTGTNSEQDRQPESLPHKFESGNHNLPGLAGLKAGVRYLLAQGLETSRQHAIDLTRHLLERLTEIEGLTVYGTGPAEERLGVVSVTLAGYDPQEVAAALDAGYGIQVRSGIHCAPRIHARLGTLEQGGTVRFSLGPMNTPEQIDALIAALQEIAAGRL